MKKDVDLKSIPDNDEAVLSQFRAGDTADVFAFDSEEMRRMLIDLSGTDNADITENRRIQ